MDRSVLISSSSGTGTGAIRHFHQLQTHQNLRNSPSAQPHFCPQQQQLSRLASSSSTSPIPNQSVATPQQQHLFNSPLGYKDNHHQVHLHRPQPPNQAPQSGYSSVGPVQSLSVPQGNYSFLPTQQRQSQHIQQQQQQQQYFQRKQTAGNFVPGSSSPNFTETSSYTQHNHQQQPPSGGTVYSRIRSEQGPSPHPQPLRVSTSSRNNCGPTPQQQLDRSPAGQFQHQHQPQRPAFSGSNPNSSAPTSSTNYCYSKSGGAELARQETQQIRPVHPQNQRHQQQQLQFQSSSQEGHLTSSVPVTPSQMPNNNHHHSQPSNSNMNKNSYRPHQTSPHPNVNLSQGPPSSPSSLQAENMNKQVLLHQMAQTPDPRGKVHTQANLVNQNQKQSEIKSESCTSSSRPQEQPQTNHPAPQYRIFKRGDSIPGISSPIQMSPSPNNSNNTAGVTADNRNSNSPADNSNLRGLNPSDTGSRENSGSDKENSNVSTSMSSPSTGNANNDANNEGNGNNGVRTPLSQIGEIARFHGVSVAYRLVKETGPPHAPTFTVLLQLGNEEYTGDGASIKKAQHAAATTALEKTSLSRPPPKSKSKKSYAAGSGGGLSGGKRPNWALIQLTNLAQELQMPVQFIQQPVPITDPFRRGDPPSIVCVHVGDKVFTGEGANFSTAKNSAVVIALKAMLKVKQEADLIKLTQAGADAEQSMMDADNKSPISIVHEMAMKRGMSVLFSIVGESGPPHMKVFTVNCKVGEELETEGQGPTKQAAKKASSELMIAKLKEIPITLPATSQGINLKAMQRGILRQKSQKKKTSTPVLKDLEKQVVSPISRLIQICHIKKFKEPEFTLISTGTENNVENFLKQITERDRRMLRKKKPVFTIEVKVGPHTCQGTGPNKKEAKKAAAEAAVIALGYGPTVDPSSEDVPDSSKHSAEQSNSNSSGTGGGGGGRKGRQDKTVKLAGAKQIAPGIIVLKSEPVAGAATSQAAAHEVQKVGGMMGLSVCPSASTREGIDKLAYLSKLLEISVSYSDFPKKNEYLSVVSLTTNPPHVAHGCGATLEEAQNAAALKILEELSTKGLDSVTGGADKPSES